MKFNAYFLFILVSTVLFTTSGCHDDGPSAKEKYQTKLEFSWSLIEAHVGETDVTDAFPDMELTVVNNDYTVLNPVNPIWPASGTYTLQKQSAAGEPYYILRSDGVAITIAELTETSLILEFPYDSEAARTNSVSGDYQFKFIKK